MFDREKQIVIDKYCKAIFSETETITVSELINLNLPESIKKFIDLEIGNQVEREFNEIKKFSKFNFEHLKIKPLVEELKILLKFNYELNYNSLSLLLKLALDLNLDYLLKPCETLTYFIFKYDDFQTSAIIQERLKYISDYEYFPILVSEYLKRTNITKITKNDFVNLLYRIEKEYSKDFTILDHYNLFSRFKQFLFELKLSINDYPEYEAFIIHLQDKNHKQLAQFLEEHKEHFKSMGISLQAYLKSLIRPAKPVSFTSEKSELESSSLEIPSEVSAEFKDAEQLKPSFETNEMISEAIEEKESLEPDLTKGSKEIESVEVKKEIADSKKQETNKELFERLTIGQSESKKKILDRNLDGLMPARFKKKVIKKIFDDNEIMFNEFMSNINKVNNWDEASLLLTELFDKKNIQPFSKWAIKFTEFLYENIT